MNPCQVNLWCQVNILLLDSRKELLIPCSNITCGFPIQIPSLFCHGTCFVYVCSCDCVRFVQNLQKSPCPSHRPRLNTTHTLYTMHLVNTLAITALCHHHHRSTGQHGVQRVESCEKRLCIPFFQDHWSPRRPTSRRDHTTRTPTCV